MEEVRVEPLEGCLLKHLGESQRWGEKHGATRDRTK